MCFQYRCAPSHPGSYCSALLQSSSRLHLAALTPGSCYPCAPPSRVFKKAGLSDEGTYLPPSIHPKICGNNPKTGASCLSYCPGFALSVHCAHVGARRCKKHAGIALVRLIRTCDLPVAYPLPCRPGLCL